MTTDGADRSFGAPRFDVVLRGYDRRQVDEHLSRLQRVLSRMRGDLDAARAQAVPGRRPGRSRARRPSPTDPAAAPGRARRPRGARRRRHLHRPHADDPAGRGGRGRGDPGEGAVGRAGRGGAAGHGAGERPGGGGDGPGHADEPAAPARRRAGRPHPRARPARGAAVGPDGADHRAHAGHHGRAARRRCRSPAARHAWRAAAADPGATVLGRAPGVEASAAPEGRPGSRRSPAVPDAPATASSDVQETTLVQVPGDARPPAGRPTGTGDPNAPAPAVAPAEQTMVMAPARPLDTDADDRRAATRPPGRGRGDRPAGDSRHRPGRRHRRGRRGQPSHPKGGAGADGSAGVTRTCRGTTVTGCRTPADAALSPRCG